MSMERIGELLLANRDSDREFWQWIHAGPDLSRKDANKFFLGCILDYQIPAELAWRNAKRLAEEILGDPEDLWAVITSRSLDEWNSQRQVYRLHRFPKAHERVYTIGKEVVVRYSSDARNIWTGQALETVLYRLNDIRLGEQISRMLAGALLDAGIVSGSGDVKVDIHVRRVLGRLINGREFSVNESRDVTALTRALNPANPWLLDRPLYRLGKSLCSAENPRCVGCFMATVCRYASEAATSPGHSAISSMCANGSAHERNRN